MTEKFLTGKTAWVTGASRGIGAEIATSLADCGSRLIISARSESSLAATRERLGEALIGVLPLDMSVQNDIESIRKLVLAFGTVPDILINNAGIARFKPMTAFGADDYNEIFNVNVYGPFSVIKSILPSMIERGSGTILNINSVSAIKTFPYNSLYAASKSAFLTMSRVLRAETCKKGIKVIDVLPGATETEIWSPENRDKLRAGMMQPSDVANVVIEALHSSANPRLQVEEIIVRPQCGDF